MIRAIALDDEPLSLELIAEFCSRLDTIDLVKTFTSPSEALKHLRKFPTDLIFLDIQMPSVSGIDFYKEITQNTMVIFTTAHSQYAVESYNLSAVDYLLKPFEYSRFQKAVQKAHEVHKFSLGASKENENYIYLRADYVLVKVATSEIIYIESLKDYLKVYCTNGKTIITRMTMKAILNTLPTDEFIRVHRSFIVPMRALKEIRNKKILLGGMEIPIGVSYETEFLKQFLS
jgi:DNA-binding LytR/AlgR family response regulator